MTQYFFAVPADYGEIKRGSSRGVVFMAAIRRAKKTLESKAFSADVWQFGGRVFRGDLDYRL